MSLFTYQMYFLGTDTECLKNALTRLIRLSEVDGNFTKWCFTVVCVDNGTSFVWSMSGNVSNNFLYLYLLYSAKQPHTHTHTFLLKGLQSDVLLFAQGNQACAIICVWETSFNCFDKLANSISQFNIEMKKNH